MGWTPQQDAALVRVQDWLNGPKDKQVFRLFGFAGTGKSTLAKHLGDIEKQRGGFAQYAAFTGKATVVMRRKGCENARTLHSIIYTTMDKSRDRLDRLNKALANASGDNRDNLIRQIEEERENLKSPGFHLKEDALTVYRTLDDDTREAVATVSLFIIDECSMVDARLGEDLLSFGARVLVLGDPAQLPPVMAGSGFFTDAQPDVLLTEIHRQALDSPIIKMANVIRGGGSLNIGDYGDGCKVVKRTDLPAQEWVDADQILVGRNETRRAFNARIRTLRGFSGFLPQPGEKLVCLRNNHEEGLLNGSLWECLAAEDKPNGPTFWLKIKSLDDDRTIACLAHKACFLGEELEPWERKESNEFDFGYALTVHKSQGSQWDNVVLFDEWTMRQSKQQWQYTGITRAAKRITVVRP